MSRFLRARHTLVGITALMLVVAAWWLEPAVVVTDVDLGGAVQGAAGEKVQVNSPSLMSMVDEDAIIEPAPAEVPEIETGVAAPLSGVLLDEAAAAVILDRPALVVKVDNHPRARPQTGLDLADIVFDLRAEGVTRFAAVFHSVIPDPVGPVRSSRTSDFDLLRGLDTPIYASSGGNDYVTAGLRELPIVELTNRSRNEYFRDFSRPAPHNLFIMGSDLYSVAGERGGSPSPWFSYRRSESGILDTGVEATGPVTISFTGSPVVTHTWDDELGGWLRTQDGHPHLTSDGVQLAPENVVVATTTYRTSPADASSPEVVSTGGGDLLVLTDGRIIAGSWSRPAASDKLSLADSAGDEIALTPGRTWVLFAEEGQVGFASGQSPP